MRIKKIKATAEAAWVKGNRKSGVPYAKRPENGPKTVTITLADLVSIAKDKMEEDIHSGHLWMVNFSDFTFEVEEE